MSLQYQKTNYYFAQVASGFEELAQNEIESLGATDVKQRYRGLSFKADPKVLYAINYGSRLITRVLAPIISFDCHSAKYLYKTALDIPWEEIFKPDQTFAIFAQVANSNITHSQYASLKLKDAIVDRFRDKVGRRPDVDPKYPYVWFNVHIENNRATLSIDTSGGSLHRRGYRLDTVEAPMQETLAAAIIKISGWNGESHLIDPMCGSGTLAAEGFMAQSGLAPGYFRRRFGFECLPDFQRGVWKQLRKEMDSRFEPVRSQLIQASDVDPAALRVAKRNLAHLPEGSNIYVHRKDYREIGIPQGSTLLMNPPYGIRLKRGEDLAPFYKDLGDWLKQKCSGSTAYVYFGERQYLKNIGLRPEWKKELRNGGLDGRLAKFVMY